MDSPRHFHLLVAVVVGLASMIAVPSVDAQDCQASSDDCDATQLRTPAWISQRLLSHNIVRPIFLRSMSTFTSDPEPTKYCERYNRTSLSDDGTTAEYDLVYRDANGDNTAINDTSTFQVANNAVIYVTYGSEYYLFNNAYSDISEYQKCLSKIYEYSGGSITFLRDLQKCQKLPPQP